MPDRTKILVVEDERGVADALHRGLTADGYDVSVARTGPDGFEAVRDERPDLVVLDLMLPGMSGEDICRTLRESGDETPILMLTAKDTDVDMITGLGLGADDYLVKPFSYVVLRSRIAAMLRRIARTSGQDATRPALIVGDLVLDADQRTVRRADTTLDLSPRMFAVLEHLMAQPGIVVSKRQLLDAVWGVDFDGDANVVEVTISRLRATVDTPFDRSSVQTVRQLGYRVRDERERVR